MRDKRTIHTMRYLEFVAELKYSEDKMKGSGLVIISSSEEECNRIFLSLNKVTPTALMFIRGDKVMMRVAGWVEPNYLSCSLEDMYKTINYIYQEKGEIYIVDSTPELSPPSCVAKYISGRLAREYA